MQKVKCAMQDPIEGYAIGACLAQWKESYCDRTTSEMRGLPSRIQIG
jgi:hypothetical protein